MTTRTHNVVFTDQTPESMREMGFSPRRTHTLSIGRNARHGRFQYPEYVGDDVLLTPLAAYRSRERAERYAGNVKDVAPDPTGRVFVVGIRYADRPAYVVLFERYM